MTKRSRYYVVDHMLGPTVIKTTDKRKITAWLNKVYDDASDEVRKTEVEDSKVELVNLIDLD